MAFSVKVLAASRNPSGDRLTTFELTYPRFIHAELMTHRMMSRNSASSRAIPIQKMIANITDEPVIPEFWGKNQSGMQSGEDLGPEAIAEAKRIIMWMRDCSLMGTEKLMSLGFHKQLSNRYLEPWMWITVIASMTSFEHFRRLRVHPAAEPHFQKLAGMMAHEYDTCEVKDLKTGHWHLPLVGVHPDDYNLSIEDAVKVSTGRCARVSYVTHEGIRDVAKDIELHDNLSTNGHWSPFEHPAQAVEASDRYGNYTGFIPYRKFFINEFVPDRSRAVMAESIG